MRKPQPRESSSVPGLDARALATYATRPDGGWKKSALDSAMERTPRGRAKAMAREADTGTRVVEAATRAHRWAPDLAAAVRAGDLPAVEASRLVAARIERAKRWQHAVADAFAAEGKSDMARRVRSQPIDRAARLWRWLRAVVAAYTDASPDLLHARGATGAAVLGFDPVD